MRIAYLLTSLGIGGAERQVVGLAERMVTRGHDVVLLTLRPKQQHQWPTSVEVIHLNMTKSPFGVARGLFRGRRYLRRFEPEILHSHTFPANIAARLLRLLGATTRIISTIHNIYEGDWKRTVAYRLTAPLSSHTTAVSQAVAKRYVQIGAVAADKLSVITNGIDIGAFDPARSKSVETGTQRFQRDFVWLAAGRAVTAKDFANLLAAFAHVRRASPRTQLWIAGASHRDRVENTQELCGVRLLGLCDDMVTTLGLADAFVLSSAWEGMPLVVAEAMAMEKPVVATDVGGVRELVGDAGVLVLPKAPAALAEAMIQTMQKSEYDRRELGRTARARIVRHFDINAKAGQWERLYANILGAKARESRRRSHGRLMSEFRDEANE